MLQKQDVTEMNEHFVFWAVMLCSAVVG